MQFSWKTGTRAVSREFVLTPDLRFLTAELLDTNTDPAEELRRRARDLSEELTRGDPPSYGPQNAPVTIVAFSDFECPFCSEVAVSLMTDIVPANAGSVRLLFRHFPLDGHPWARAAAEATACVGLQSGSAFWQLHDYIFTHQADITTDNIARKLAEKAGTLDGFDAARYQRCVDGHESAAAVDTDSALGSRMQISSTPTLFINGERVVGYQPEQTKTIIRELLRQQGRKGTETGVEPAH